MAAQRTVDPGGTTAGEQRRQEVHLASGALRDGPLPKHVQLREILRELASGELLPGSPVPSERELATRYGVSRLTVREAVGQLVADGLLVRVRGKGTFTTRPRVDSALHLASFSEDMRRRGMRPETVVLDGAEAVPPHATAEALGLPAGSPAYWLFRLRKADGAPMAVERGWYHPELVPGLLGQCLTDSLYTLLDRVYGVRLEHGTQTVLAEGADPETARLLGVRPGSPVLVFRRVSTAQGRPVEDTGFLVPGRPVPGDDAARPQPGRLARPRPPTRR